MGVVYIIEYNILGETRGPSHVSMTTEGTSRSNTVYADDGFCTGREWGEGRRDVKERKRGWDITGVFNCSAIV